MRYDRGMVRTRNFLIFVGAIGFLVVAIVFTLLLFQGRGSSIRLGYVPMSDFDTTTATYTAEVAMVPDTRFDRLATMRRKLSEIKTELRAPVELVTELVSEPESTPATSAETTESETVATVTLCPTKRVQTIVWPVSPLKYAVRANQRVFYSEVITLAADASSTPVITERVVLTLPLRGEALSFTSCIASDVVAVTTTGLPIRNSDFGKYQGVGPSTLIGYSLDGFEIYGESGAGVITDACGGTAASGVYRYYLSDPRAGVLGCFAGIPVLL